jgi:hypothetical protein
MKVARFGHRFAKVLIEHKPTILLRAYPRISNNNQTSISIHVKLPLVFVRTQADTKVAETKSKKRTRRDVPAIMLDDYLAECKENDNRPSLADGWRYLEARPEVIDFKPGQIIFYKTKSGKEKKLTRDQLSDRLSRALEPQ